MIRRGRSRPGRSWPRSEDPALTRDAAEAHAARIIARREEERKAYVIHALMDEGETLLRAGDCLVQRGTNHTWSNRSDAPCLVAFILLSARPA